MKKLTSWGIIIAGVIMLGVIYFFIDPSQYHMPRCPFNALTGLLCPGCGSQRAIHALLHMNICQAFNFNALLIIALPYVVLGGLLQLFDKKNRFILWLRLNLFGRWAAYIWGIVIIAYWICRNLNFYNPIIFNTI